MGWNHQLVVNFFPQTALEVLQTLNDALMKTKRNGRETPPFFCSMPWLEKREALKPFLA